MPAIELGSDACSAARSRRSRIRCAPLATAQEPGGLAIHCKAGLGRTGTLIGLYIMKHWSFSAAETIGWLRICRPGSVIGPQQNFLHDMEKRMWKEGEAYRKKTGNAVRTDEPKSVGYSITQQMRQLALGGRVSPQQQRCARARAR